MPSTSRTPTVDKDTQIAYFEELMDNIASHTVGYENLSEAITTQVNNLSDKVIKILFDLLKTPYYTETVHKKLHFPIIVQVSDVRGQLLSLLSLKMMQIEK